MSTTVIWIVAGIVMAGTLVWNLRTMVKDRREARGDKADFAKTKLAAEMRDKPRKPPRG